jgi:two-component system cell cycle sensor histidine kinase PleC
VFAVVEAARKMTEGDHGARVAPVGGAAPGEFMMLQQSFNNMADALEKSDREQATALAEAEAANHSKTRFLANMSHELRTPLNAIIGFSDLIANRRFGPNLDERYREYAHDILSSGNHPLSLIEDILDMSKIESGEFEPEESDVDISEEIAYSVSFIEGPAREKNIELRRDIPEGIPLLRADRRMARQILINLLSNAVKLTRPGGIVRVNVHLDESSSLGLVVADNGVGIPEADLSVITGAFKQADNHLKQDQRGTGLGLAIARSLVEAHEGTLGITSQVGEGTTVTVTFPPERTIRTG